MCCICLKKSLIFFTTLVHCTEDYTELEMFIISQPLGQRRRQTLLTCQASRRLTLKSSVGTILMMRRSVSCQAWVLSKTKTKRPSINSLNTLLKRSHEYGWIAERSGTLQDLKSREKGPPICRVKHSSTIKETKIVLNTFAYLTEISPFTVMTQGLSTVDQY